MSKCTSTQSTWICLIALFLCCLSTGSLATTIDNPALQVGGDGGIDDRFGDALALSGDTLIVGAPRDNPNGANSGSVYVFHRIAGVFTFAQRLVPTDSTGGTQFGYSVALFGNTLIIGSPYWGNADEGAAYVYELDAGQYVFRQKLLVTPMAQPRYFGWAVAAGPDAVWVGSPAHRVAANFQGSATQYERDEFGNWIQGPDFGIFGGTGGETFGVAMAYANGHLIVGASGEDVGNQGFAGAAVAYRYDGNLTQLNIFSAPGVQSFDQFGKSVAMSGDRAVIGAPSNQRSGYVQVFRREGAIWMAEGTPLVLGPVRYGHAVAMDGDRIAASEISGNGVVQIYERVDGAWVATTQLAPTDLESDDEFGYAIALGGPDAIVGIPGRDVTLPATNVGQVRVLPVPSVGVFRDGFE